MIMRKFVLFCTCLCAMAFVAQASAAHAQAYVMTTGSDSNPCTQASPCLTFQRAYATIAPPSNSIHCLDSGSFSNTTLTITGSVTIDCWVGNVGHMGMSGGGTAAININASSSAVIVLKNLSIGGSGSAANASGVITTSLPGGGLVIIDCEISNFPGSGVLFTPNTGSSGGRASLVLVNTTVGKNNIGVSVAPASGQIASVLFVNDIIGLNTGDGLDLAGAGVVAGDLRQSTIANNNGNGFVGSSAGGVYFTIEGSTFSANLGVGIETNSAAANVDVAASAIGGNGMGIRALSGSLLSFGDNHISANGSNGTFTGVTPLQ
jgi:hypothetical protein